MEFNSRRALPMRTCEIIIENFQRDIYIYLTNYLYIVACRAISSISSVVPANPITEVSIKYRTYLNRHITAFTMMDDNNDVI